MSKTANAADPGARSPLAGCAIFIAAFVMMIFLIGFSVMTLFRQFNEIAKFTEERPVPVTIATLEEKEGPLNTLAERIETFRQQLDGPAESSLALSVDDLNLAIAAYEPFKELRGTFHVMTITPESLRAAISFPLNGRPRLARPEEPGWVASDPRFLNAEMVTVPTLAKKEIVLKIDAIQVPGAKVPPEFIDQMSPYRITERYLADKVLGPAMAKITRVELTDGKVVFKRVPGEIAAGTISNATVDSASNRLFKAFAIAASIFLIFVAVVIFFGMRAKKRRAI